MSATDLVALVVACAAAALVLRVVVSVVTKVATLAVIVTAFLVLTGAVDISAVLEWARSMLPDDVPRPKVL